MNTIDNNIMALAHRWSLATYNKALGKEFEDFDEIQKALRATIEQALAQGLVVAEIYRRQLEAIAVGDSTDPVKDAGELLVETGFWHSIPDTAPQPKPKPPWITYDAATDVLTIHGKRYSAAMFGEDGFLAPPGALLRIERGPTDVVTVTTVQPQPEWVDLTDEELSEAMENADFTYEPTKFARVIETTLREKNGGEA
jgi:hypothetical protein